MCALLNFQEELKKYKPVMGMDEVEKSVKDDEVKDVMDMLQYLSNKLSGSERSK